MDTMVRQAVVNAIQTRKILGVDTTDAIEDIFKLLHYKEDINIIRTPLKGNMSGFFMRKGDANLIAVNTCRTLGHQIFTAAHELYHLKYDKEMTGKICVVARFDENYQNEILADYFASHLLMPDDALKFELNKRLIKGKGEITINDIVYLENHFMISHAAMLRRLKYNGEITEKQYNDYKDGITREAARLGYGVRLYRTSENEGTIKYSNYAELANELTDKNLITYGKYEELMISGGYEDIVFGEYDDFEDIKE